jgi:hypothetical protein
MNASAVAARRVALARFYEVNQRRLTQRVRLRARGLDNATVADACGYA